MTEGISQTATVVAADRRLTLSALICNYNHRDYIGNAIKAILRQTRLPDEVLLMDDGSVDGSFEIMQRYAAQCPLIRVFRVDRNQGYIKGISQLTELATGDFIHRGASDDYMLPNFVEETMAMAERHPEVGIVSGILQQVDERTGNCNLLGIDGWQTGFIDPDTYLQQCLLNGDPCSTLAPSTIFRRSVVNELGGWREELDTWDVSFVLQAAALKYGMGYIGCPVYTWTHREDAWTQRTVSDLDRSVEIYARYFDLLRSADFRDLFGDVFPQRWLAANIRNTAESRFHTLVSQVLRRC